VGETEIGLLGSYSEAEREIAEGRLFQFQVPCIVVTKDLDVPYSFLQRAEERGIPVLGTPMSTTPFIHELTAYLDDIFAPASTTHGSLVDVYGVGLLFTGRSGIGKSECALDLVERGHRLVADDVVTIKRRHENVLIGSANKVLGHHIEIRGVGIIDLQKVFGIRAIRFQKGSKWRCISRNGRTAWTTSAPAWRIASPRFSVCRFPWSRCRSTRARISP
jgi:HPr kinase/phosphorylase